MPGPQPKDYAITTVRLPTADLEWARARAEELGVSVSWVVRNAIKAVRAVEEHE